jgi:hypothetical protein
MLVLQPAELGNHGCDPLMQILTHPPFVRLMRKQVEAEVLACLMLCSFFPSIEAQVMHNNNVSESAETVCNCDCCFVYHSICQWALTICPAIATD